MQACVLAGGFPLATHSMEAKAVQAPEPDQWRHDKTTIFQGLCDWSLAQLLQKYNLDSERLVEHDMTLHCTFVSISTAHQGRFPLFGQKYYFVVHAT